MLDRLLTRNTVSDPSGTHVCMELLGGSGSIVSGLQYRAMSHTDRHGSRQTEAIMIKICSGRLASRCWTVFFKYICACRQGYFSHEHSSGQPHAHIRSQSGIQPGNLKVGKCATESALRDNGIATAATTDDACYDACTIHNCCY